MTGKNDVPEYLNELIPYRCPKCGNLRRFATLRELHQHLQMDHSFQMGFNKPHTRACVFKRTNDVINDSSDRISGKNSQDYEKINRKDNRLNNSIADFRESSPVLKSFKEEKERLEKELQRAIQSEMKNKTISMQNLSGNTINADCHTSLSAIPGEQNPNKLPSRVYAHEPTMHQPFVEKTRMSTLPRFGDYAMNAAMSSLNSDMLKSRMNQWVTTDALYKSQELLSEMETSAENKCQEQRNIIQHLINDMKMKDEQIELSKKRHLDLKNEREKLLKETEALALETDNYNSRLQLELNDKHGELDDLNRELSRLRKLSEHELRLKSQDLQQATEKVKRLELERDNLIQETEKILKLADVDNDRLKKQLEEKETELHNVNENLKQIRLQQEQMLEKTMDVYQSSEDGREIMQTAIKTKDSQLQQALQQIENMSSLQQRLVEQSRVLTDQADDNTANMKRLLQAKAKQMEDLMTQLETLRSEKHHLESNSACLAEKAESSESAVESLQGMVKQKEDELKATQCELQHLRKFLKSAADKERVARQRLEHFIEDLIDRAERAESELRSLKSQSTDTLKNEDSTERKSLPSTLHPIQQKSFDSAEAIRMPETFVEDSDTFVENILHKSISLQNKTNSSEYDEPTYCTEEVEDVITCVNQMSPQPLQGSGGFTVTERHIDNRSHIKNSLRRKTQKTDYDSDGDIESCSLNNSKHTDKKQINKSRRNRSASQYGMTDSDSKLDNSSHRKNSSGRFKGHQMKYHPSRSDMKDENHISEGNHISGGNQHFTGSTSIVNDSKRKHTYLAAKGQENKVSRGLQVGAFLSLQDVQGDTTCDDSDNCSADSYESDDQVEEYITVDLQHVPNDIEMKTSYTASTSKRPVTIGKSHKQINTMKKKVRQKKANLNDGFDTNFPIVHRSMVDICGDFRDLSEGEVRYRDRRSRSLSPRAMDAQQFSMVPDITRAETFKIRKTKAYQQDEDDEHLEYSMDTTVTDDLSNEFDKTHEDETERTDGAFKNIMDENGILWDNDMATLPDVSDSELDRVSPSGSEAISSKRRALHIDKDASDSQSKNSIAEISENARRNKQNDSLVATSTSNVVSTINKSKKPIRKGSYPSKGKSSTTMSNTDHKGVSFSAHTFSYTQPQREEVVERISDKIFKPIDSPAENKSSVSDKDMSSGGQEVHSYMRKSPKIEIHGSSETKSYTGTSSNSSKNLMRDSKYHSRSSYSDRQSIKKTKPIDNENEPIHERINRISRKYSPKHTKTSTELECSPNIEDKVLSINEKYNRRRQDILRSKGISMMEAKTNESSMTSEHIEKRPHDRIARARIKQSVIRSSGHRMQEQQTANMNNPFGFSQIPVNFPNTLPPYPLPYTDFTKMPPYAGFTGTQDGVDRASSMPNTQFPPMYPYLPNYMMHQYAVGSFSHRSSIDNFPLQDGMLPHTSHNHSQQSFNQDQLAAPHTNAAFGDDMFMSKEQPECIPVQSKGLVKTIGVENEMDTDKDNKIDLKTCVNNISEIETNVLTDQSRDVMNTSRIQDNVKGDNAAKTNKHHSQASECGISGMKLQTRNKLHYEECDGSGQHNPYPQNIGGNTSDFETGKAIDQCNATMRTRKTKDDKENQDNIEFTHFDPQVNQSNFTDMETSNRSLFNMPVADEHVLVTSSLYNPANKDIIVAERLAEEYVEEMDHEVKEIDTTRDDFQSYVSPDMKFQASDQSLNPVTDSLEAVDTHIGQQDELGISAPHLNLFDDIDRIDSSVGLSNFSVFAEEIGDDTSIGYETNSYLELPGNATESELDGETDTESVRREFYEKSKHIHEVLEASQNDRTDRPMTNMSSTSSQG